MDNLKNVDDGVHQVIYFDKNSGQLINSINSLSTDGDTQKSKLIKIHDSYEYSLDDLSEEHIKTTVYPHAEHLLEEGIRVYGKTGRYRYEVKEDNRDIEQVVQDNVDIALAAIPEANREEYIAARRICAEALQNEISEDFNFVSNIEVVSERIYFDQKALDEMPKPDINRLKPDVIKTYIEDISKEYGQYIPESMIPENFYGTGKETGQELLSQEIQKLSERALYKKLEAAEKMPEKEKIFSNNLNDIIMAEELQQPQEATQQDVAPAQETEQKTQQNEEQKPPLSPTDYLLRQVEYTGFKLTTEQQNDLLKHMANNENSFSFPVHKEYHVPGQKSLSPSVINYDLHFSQGKNGGYFFNDYDATLQKAELNANGGMELSTKTQCFYVQHEHGRSKETVTALEAFNLLDGRYVNKNYTFDPKEGEQAVQGNYWTKLNFDEKTESGNYKTIRNSSQWFDLKNILNEYGITNADDKTINSLKKGNVTEVNLTSKDGKPYSLLASVNPNIKMKALDFTNKAGETVHRAKINRQEPTQMQAEQPQQGVTPLSLNQRADVTEKQSRAM